MPRPARNVAEEFRYRAPDKDAFAIRSQAAWRAPPSVRIFAGKIAPVASTGGKAGSDSRWDKDEIRSPETRSKGHPR